MYKSAFLVAAIGLSACVASTPDTADSTAARQAADGTLRVRCEAVIEPCLVDAREACPEEYLIQELDRRSDGTGRNVYNTRMTVVCHADTATADGGPVQNTAEITCAEHMALGTQQCSAVFDRGEPGYATMTATRPDGFERVLVFSPDAVAVAGGAVPIAWDRDNDSWYIVVQNSEVYFVWDGDIYGQQHPAFAL